MKIPFWSVFSIIVLIIELLLIINHKEVNKEIQKSEIDTTLGLILVSIPYFCMVYLDIRYKAFSLNRIIATKYNTPVNYMLNLAGSYGMIQVLGQDSGIKTGERQRDTIQNWMLFAVISLGMAYSVTNNRSQSFLAVLAYFHLKYVWSNNKTSKVCFEEV